MAHEPDDTTPSVKADPALGSLDARIDAAKKTESERLAKEHVPMRAANSGLSIASTMVGYPLGGIVIGFALDHVFKTTPWITIALMFIAFAGACLQVTRGFNNRAD